MIRNRRLYRGIIMAVILISILLPVSSQQASDRSDDILDKGKDIQLMDIQDQSDEPDAPPDKVQDQSDEPDAPPDKVQDQSDEPDTQPGKVQDQSDKTDEFQPETVNKRLSAPNTGQLEIIAKTGAALYLDGVYIGVLPFGKKAVLGDVPIGAHTVTLSYGKEKETKSVMLVEGMTETLYFTWRDILPVNTSNGFIRVEGGGLKLKISSGGSTKEKDIIVGNFIMSQHEVTHRDFLEFLNDAPVSSSGMLNRNLMIILNSADAAIKYSKKFQFVGSRIANSIDTPVIGVTWYGAVEYCNWLSRKKGRDPVYNIGGSTVNWDRTANGYRLPTEAEWEYAARGGSYIRGFTYAGSNNIDEAAWYKANSGNRTHTVGRKKANELGIFDLTGNVWEWCWDEVIKTDSPVSLRALRGGGWKDSETDSLIARRIDAYPDSSANFYGFRLAASERLDTFSGFGEIVVKTEISGKLFLNGKYMAVMAKNEEGRLRNIRSGFHNVEIRFGGMSVRESVSVKKNQVAEVSFTGSKNVLLPNSFVLVKGGAFQMGSDSGQYDEQPVHTVTVENFAMSQYEVTYREFLEFMNNAEVSPQGMLRGRKVFNIASENAAIKYDRKFYFNSSVLVKSIESPIIEVPWFGALEYCNWRSKKENRYPAYTIMDGNVTWDRNSNGYRLPTEAEWEFAASGGVLPEGYPYAGSRNINLAAWYGGNSSGKTHPVGLKQPNVLKLYDMSGNVMEWCGDWYSTYQAYKQDNPVGPPYGEYRVIRGGGWNGFSSTNRITNRDYGVPENGYNDVGFRLVLSVF
ncbi:MAG: hypothetical protein B0D92_03070 [Spirochaeta sp. LUC14_002_19_P3]|nr:MAG: hypothetical protein B0D92_03070 [Spirochaeta sp. LUC14_002_19_P3]